MIDEITFFQRVKQIRYFTIKQKKYIWDYEDAKFFQCQGVDRNISLFQLHSYTGGLKEEDAKMRQALYGKNIITVPVQTIPALLVKQILSPFYVFQLFSICFWYADHYWLYATVVMVS